jgi:hypothetical protein
MVKIVNVKIKIPGRKSGGTGCWGEGNLLNYS